MKWPSTLVTYKRTDRFNQDSVPEKFLSEHKTKDGVWAMIRVVDGEVKLIREGAESETLNRRFPGFVQPNEPHRLELLGDVEFYLEFFRDSKVGS